MRKYIMAKAPVTSASLNHGIYAGVAEGLLPSRAYLMLLPNPGINAAAAEGLLSSRARLMRLPNHGIYAGVGRQNLKTGL